jgi:hypothetical protein
MNILGRTTVRTNSILCKPGLPGLHGVGAVGVGGDSKICLILPVELEVSFNQDEHTPWLQTFNELSNSLGVICHLRRVNISAQLIH